MLVTDATYPRVYSDVHGPIYIVSDPDQPMVYVFTGGVEVCSTVRFERSWTRGRPVPYEPLSAMSPELQASYRDHCAKRLRHDCY